MISLSKNSSIPSLNAFLLWLSVLKKGQEYNKKHYVEDLLFEFW